jgi:hypothetical protein
MGSPTVHVITTTRSEVQAVVRSTLAMAKQPDTRVIIVVSDASGKRERSTDARSCSSSPVILAAALPSTA